MCKGSDSKRTATLANLLAKCTKSTNGQRVLPKEKESQDQQPQKQRGERRNKLQELKLELELEQNQQRQQQQQQYHNQRQEQGHQIEQTAMGTNEEASVEEAGEAGTATATATATAAAKKHEQPTKPTDSKCKRKHKYKFKHQQDDGQDRQAEWRARRTAMAREMGNCNNVASVQQHVLRLAWLLLPMMLLLQLPLPAVATAASMTPSARISSAKGTARELLFTEMGGISSPSAAGSPPQGVPITGATGPGTGSGVGGGVGGGGAAGIECPSFDNSACPCYKFEDGKCERSSELIKRISRRRRSKVYCTQDVQCGVCAITSRLNGGRTLRISRLNDTQYFPASCPLPSLTNKQSKKSN